MMTRRTFQAGGLWVAAGSQAFGADAPNAAGTWSGLLEAGSQRLRLKVEVGRDGTATLVSMDEAPLPEPGRLTVLASEQVALEFPTIRAMFSGHFVGPDRIEGLWRQGIRFEGQWRKGFLSLPLAFTRGEAALRVPPPVGPLTGERLAELRAEAGSPAIGAASVRRGSISPRVWVAGERAIGTGIAAQESDLWHLGSIGKSMTSSLVARLADGGAVHWDETVGDILGEVAPEMHDAYRGASFRHLLCHRSGLPVNFGMNVWQFSREIADAREERKSYVRKSLAMPPVGPMTATFEYSSHGYVVAGAMLEAKLGRSWEDLVRTHLFQPLGLLTAGFGAPGRAGATDQPLGHVVTASGEARLAYPVGPVSDYPVVLGPAGRVHMGLQDLLRYLGAHRDRSDYLKPETWTILHTPPFGGHYAMGWVVRNGTLWHSGHNTLWYAEAQVDPGRDTVAAAACNDGHRPKSSPAVGRAMLEAAAAA